MRSLPHAVSRSQVGHQLDGFHLAAFDQGRYGFFELLDGLEVPAGEQLLEHAPLHLDGVQLRGVRGQEHQPDGAASRLYKLGNHPGVVARGVVHHQDEFGIRLEQILQEFDERLRVYCVDGSYAVPVGSQGTDQFRGFFGESLSDGIVPAGTAPPVFCVRPESGRPPRRRRAPRSPACLSPLSCRQSPA